MSVTDPLSFTGGQNDVQRADRIGIDQVQASQNYEILGGDTLTRRTAGEAYDSALNDYLIDTLDFELVTAISPPWYPPNKPSDMTGEYFIVVYGKVLSTASYEMFLLYETSGGWTHLTGATNLLQGLTDAGVDWTVYCDPKFSIGNNRMVITDGVNRAYYIAVDSDGDIQSSILGIPSPTNKPYLTPSEGYDSTDFTSDSANNVSAPGLVQVAYTAVTKDGLESNPSPLSDTLDLQWFTFDDDGNDATWIAKLNISNLTVPDVAPDILNDLKYFNVYIRVFRNSAGSVPGNLQFTQQFNIIDKDTVSSTPSAPSKNAYAITLESSAGEVISYENDIAPIASLNAQNGGVIMLGGTKSKSMIGYPWSFGYYVEIKLNNQNAETFIDAVVTIRLVDEDAPGGITGLDWDYYLASPGTSKSLDENGNALRMYDTDGITPLQVMYNDNAAIQDVVVCRVRIPQLSPGVHPIYLCWSSAASPMAGVTDTNYNSGYMGQWMALTSEQATAAPLMFTDGVKVNDLNTLVSAPCEHFISSDKVPNKADALNPGTLTDMAQQAVAMGNVPSIDFGVLPPTWFVDENSLIATGAAGTKTCGLSFDVSKFGTAPKKGYAVFRFSFTPNDGRTHDTYYNIFGLYGAPGATSPPIINVYLNDAANLWKFRVGVWDGAATQTQLFTIPAVSTSSTTRLDLGVVFSWDDDAGKASIFIYDFSQPATPFTYDEQDLPASIQGTVLDEAVFGRQAGTTTADDGFPLHEIDQILVVGGKYLSAAGAGVASAAWNLLNFMPPMANPLGYYYGGGPSWNANIEIDTEVQTFETKDEDNKFRWSDVNGINFPDLYSKRLREPLNAMVPAPSFLQFQYQNTMVIFTRNTINRFIMADDPSTWAADPSRLVKEKENYALYAPNSLAVAGERLFWLSEDGIIMWDPQGLQKISKYTIDIPLSATDESIFVGMFQPIRDQYILHNFTSLTSYVYHIGFNAFYKFYGLELSAGIPVILSGGLADENVNLMIDNTLGLGGTELMPNQVDRDFSGPSAWANVDIDSYSEVNELELVASGVGQYCTCPIASVPMDIGATYRLSFEFDPSVGSWDIKSFDGTQTYGRVSDAGSQSLTITATTTGGIRIVAVDLDSEAVFDDFSLKRYGPVINKYPGDFYTTESAYITTRDFNHIRATFLRWLASFNDGSAVSSVTTTVDNKGTSLTDTKTPLADSDSDQWKWITNGKNLGGSISFTITGPDELNYLLYEFLSRGAR